MEIKEGIGHVRVEYPIGTVFEPFHCRVDSLDLCRFAEAIGGPHPRYRSDPAASDDGGSGNGPAAPVPPTYPFALEMKAGPGQARLCRLLGLDPLRTLHVRQSFEWHGEMRAGDDLTGKTSVVSSVDKGRLRSVTLETEWSSVRAGLLLVSRTTLAERRDEGNG